ncbi:MAG TPA: peptidoglycan DD-metalloendopeptidase family protein, partial [Pseudolabrys sp.]|nr:peptidoglycan DD-metalloendopeptidase family protein [Pseudolabrys sp.]
SAAVNFSYPWRDNFCELRDFVVGQCPGGHGHQGEDIRPSNCVLSEKESDRCLPYQHKVTAVRDGVIWRRAGNLGLWIVVNTPNDLVRFRYLHMNPKMMDADGMLSGRKVSEGEIIGKVSTWGDYPRGTSYHIHFNIQVFTKSGWAWVSPYMTLVLAYERLIGARGVELKPGDPAPPVPEKAPIIASPMGVTIESSASESAREKKAVRHAGAKHRRHHPVHRRYRGTKHRRHHRG